MRHGFATAPADRLRRSRGEDYDDCFLLCLSPRMTTHGDRLPWLAAWLDDECASAADAFAEWFHVTPEEVRRAMGQRWLRVRDGFADPAYEYWAVGEPVQVVVGLGPQSLVIIEPNGEVFGTLETVSASSPVRVARPRATLSGAADVTRQTAKRRRRRFRWCDSCLRLVPPEDRQGRQCVDCWASETGVVFQREQAVPEQGERPS